MKYPAETYARAYIEVLDGAKKKDQAEVTKKFISVVEKNGDLGGLKNILREAEKIAVKKGGGRFIEVEVARESDSLTKKIISLFSAKDHIEIKERPELLAGARVLIDGERELDFSFASKVRKLFS